MPGWLQFLNGSRDQDCVELDAAASLIIGSGRGCHIKVSDHDIGDQHCTLYPAQGAYWLQDMGKGRTFVDLKPVVGETVGLKPNQVFILGATYVKFWPDEPPAASGGGGGGGGAGGGDSKKVQELTAELEMLQSWRKEGEERYESLRKENERLRQDGGGGGGGGADSGELQERIEEVERLNEALLNAADRLDQMQNESEAARLDSSRMKIELENVQEMAAKDIERARGEGRAKGKAEGRAEMQPKLDELQEKLSAGAADIQAELESTKKTLQAKLTATREELEGKLRSTREKLQAELKSTQGSLESELEAAKAALESAYGALEALGVQRPAHASKSSKVQQQEELSQALDALGLAPAERELLREVVAGEIDRESIRRFSGPALEWIDPKTAVGRDQELRGVANRGAAVDLALHLEG